MTVTAGVDVGSTYTKAVLLVDGEHIEAKAMNRTGFRLAEAAERTLGEACAAAGITPDDVDSVASTGYGRHQVEFRRLNVTDLTAAARGARSASPRRPVTRPQQPTSSSSTCTCTPWRSRSRRSSPNTTWS